MNCIELLREPIGLDTTNPPKNEEPTARYLAGILEPMGFKCEMQDSGGGWVNLIAALDGRGGSEFMLDRHLNVVPTVGKWGSSSFSIEEKDGKLCGRGACDMKDGIAAMCEAAIRYAARKEPMKGKLKLSFMADEECPSLGALGCLKTHEKGNYAIIEELTRLEVAVAHRGVSRNYINVKGAPRRTTLSTGEEGAMMKVCRAVRTAKDMNETLRHITHPILPPPSIATTITKGYEKDNVMSGNIHLLLDLGIHPGVNHEQVGQFLDKGFEQAGIDGFQRTLHSYMPGGEIPQDSRFVKPRPEERERRFKIKSDPQPFDASCEQCSLAREGIQTVVRGPEDVAQTHTAGEFTWEKQARDVVSLYERITDRVLYKTNYA